MKFIEDEHQAMLIKWADFTRLNTMLGTYEGTIGKYLIHIPNGGKRNAREAGRLKAQGVRAGFPDLFLFIPASGYFGFAIEMKRPVVKGKPKPATSEAQRAWIKRLEGQRYHTAICYGWDDAREQILAYLSNNLGGNNE